MVRYAEDVLDDLQIFSGKLLKDSGISLYTPQAPLAESVNAEEKPPEDARRIILDNLSYTPLGVDELLRACQLTVPVVQSILLELEIAGCVQRLPGNRVSLIKEE